LTSGPAFDSQPVYSPDGRQIAWLSDASGAESIWVAQADGSQARRVSPDDGDPVLVSPEWSADGKTIFVSQFRADLNAFELWRFDVATQRGVPVVPIRATAEQPRSSWTSSLGARPSVDGRYLYYASHSGEFDFDRLPEWTIQRRDLGSNHDETLVSAPRSPRTDLVIGTAMRPAIAPDGRTLVYAAAHVDARACGCSISTRVPTAGSHTRRNRTSRWRRRRATCCRAVISARIRARST
jgi:Tol biopolymer transport system component